MIRNWFSPIILCAVIILTVGAAVAQPTDGWAYLYNGVTRELARVDVDGTVTPISLNLPESAYLGAYDTAFTGDGSRLAYCTLDYTVTPAAAALTVTDLATGANVFQQPLGETMGCWANYSADESMIAVSLVNYFEGDPSADVTRPIWEIRVLDADSGAEMITLSPFDGTTAEIGLFNDFALMPDVRYFDNNQVIFTGIPWGTEGVPIEPAFLWDLNTGAVQAFDDWWHWGLSVSGADVVWLDYDPALPVGDPGGPVPLSNIVRTRDAAGELVTIYHSPDWILLDSEFIEGGARLALSLLEPFDPNDPAPMSETRWIALDRAGNVTDLATTGGFSQVANAPGGYWYLSASSPDIGASITLEYRAGGETRTLFSDTSDNSGAAWTLIGASPVTPAADLPPFPAR